MCCVDLELIMKELSLQEIKSIEFSLLEEIDKICRKEKIRYSLIGGTLLGAVRHKGFIPWDDDVDIMMPRKDYNRFIEYCKKNSCVNFNLLCNELEESYGYLFAKACSKNTMIKEENISSNGIELGVYVDIFPADGLGNSYKDARKKLESSRFLREVLIAKNWRKFFKSKTHAWYYEPIRFFFFAISRLFSRKKIVSEIQKKYMNIDFDSVKYVGVISGSYRSKEIVETQLYSRYTELQFEGKNFMALEQYDEYLKHIYGNYMELPSEEKRKSHHMFVAYYK